MKEFLKTITVSLLGTGYFICSFFMPQNTAYFLYNNLKDRIYEFIESI